MNKISLIAPSASISIIRNYQIAKKAVVQLPKEIVALARCENVSCITNTKGEPVRSRHLVVPGSPPLLRCAYCGREVKDVAASLLPE